MTAPPNVFVDNLASTGIIGSLAFLFLVFVTTADAVAGSRTPSGPSGLVVLLGHYVDGLFDIFWIGASSTGPLIIAGISLGVADLARLVDGPVPGAVQGRPAAPGGPAHGPPGCRDPRPPPSRR